VIPLRPGTKQRIIGGVLVALSALIALLSRGIGFELDPFFVMLGVLGVFLFLIGSMRQWADRGRTGSLRTANPERRGRA
jgi:hypothetical protein